VRVTDDAKMPAASKEFTPEGSPLARSPTGRSAATPAAKAGGTRAAISAAKQGESHFTHFDEAGRARMVDVGGKDITHRVARATGRIVMAPATLAMIRDGRATKDAAYLTNLIYPHRRLQERFYSILPFLAQHGLDLPQQLLGQVQLSCPDHMVRTV